MSKNSLIDIHRLAPGDLDTMNAMLALFGDAFEEPDTYTAARPDAEYTRKLLASGSFIALAALFEGRVVGALTAYELQKFEQARSEIYIYDLAVAEAYRRRGIATALIERVRQIAAERGAWVVVIQADQAAANEFVLMIMNAAREAQSGCTQIAAEE